MSTSTKLALIATALLVPSVSAGDLPHVPGVPLTGGPTEIFGGFVAGAGDVDGDGHDDVIVSGADDAGPPYGLAHVFSGADGSELFSFPNAGATTFFGEPGRGVGDVDGDGRPDIVVSSRGGDPDHQAVELYSGRNGALLFAWSPNVVGLSGRISAAGAGDVDADGTPDFVIADGQILIGGGYALVFASSGR